MLTIGKRTQLVTFEVYPLNSMLARVWSLLRQTEPNRRWKAAVGAGPIALLAGETDSGLAETLVFLSPLRPDETADS